MNATFCLIKIKLGVTTIDAHLGRANFVHSDNLESVLDKFPGVETSPIIMHLFAQGMDKVFDMPVDRYPYIKDCINTMNKHMNYKRSCLKARELVRYSFEVVTMN